MRRLESRRRGQLGPPGPLVAQIVTYPKRRSTTMTTAMTTIQPATGGPLP
jgi:hypothetical protein